MNVKPKRETISDDLIRDDFSGWELLNRENISYLKQLPGIYEISIYNPTININIVVYVGESGIDLKERLMDHCIRFRYLNGKPRSSNIYNELNQISHRWNKYFRFIYLNSRKISKSEEGKLLNSYDYAWNIQDNNKLNRRQINWNEYENNYYKFKINEIESSLQNYQRSDLFGLYTNMNNVKLKMKLSLTPKEYYEFISTIFLIFKTSSEQRSRFKYPTRRSIIRNQKLEKQNQLNEEIDKTEQKLLSERELQKRKR